MAASIETAGNSNLYLLDRNGGVIRRLTDDPGIEVSPSWSPDSRQIAFVSDRGGSPQIYILDLASGRSRRLTFAGSYNTTPDWSPRGDRIAYTGRVGSRFAIFTIGTDGGEPKSSRLKVLTARIRVGRQTAGSWRFHRIAEESTSCT